MSEAAENDETGDRRSGSPQSVTRVIRILEALCASPGPMSLADLSRALATPKSSLAALLRGLGDAELVSASEGAYTLAPGAFGLGSALVEARRRQQSSDPIRDGMRRLAAQSGETVLFAVADGDGETMTYVDMVESGNSVRFAVRVGDRRPLYATAGGRVLLAALAGAELDGYFARLKAEQLGPHTQTDPRALRDAVEAVRQEGIARTVDQAADGVTGTAAAIRDAGGNTLGALVVAAPSSRSHDRSEELARLVVAEATTISRALGYR